MKISGTQSALDSAWPDEPGADWHNLTRRYAQTEERLNRIRIFCRHGSKDIGRVCHMTAHYKIRIGKAPGFLRRLFQHFSDAVGEDLMIVAAQLLLRIRQAFVETQLGFRNVGFRKPQRFATNHI